MSHNDLPLTPSVVNTLHDYAQRSAVDALNVVATVLEEAHGATREGRDAILFLATNLARRAAEREADRLPVTGPEVVYEAT